MKYRSETTPLSRDVNSAVFYKDPRELSVPRSFAISDSLLARFTSSVSKNGFFDPLTVSDDKVIDGKKRYTAAVTLGISSLPCISASDPFSPAASPLIDSIFRSSDFFDTAEMIAELCNTFLYSRDEVSDLLSVSSSFVANKLRLLRFGEEERDLIRNEHLTERHARTLLRISDTSSRMEAAKIISSCRMTVAATEHYIDSLISADTDEEKLSRLVRSALSDIPSLTEIRISRSSDPTGETLTVSCRIS